MTQQLKSKAWADIVESLIGCIYLEAGEKAAMEFLVYLGIISEVPQGFGREPTVQITEVHMSTEDDQLAVDIAAVETAAATLGVADADTAAPEATQAGAVAAEPAGDADVAMTDAKDSARATPDTDLADRAQDVAAATATPTAAAAAAVALAPTAAALAPTAMAATPVPAAQAVVAAAQAPVAESLVPATAQHAAVASAELSQSADKDTAPSTDSAARDSDREEDMVVDESGYGPNGSYSNGVRPDSLHPAQANGLHANGVETNAGQDCLPELSVSSANDRGASAVISSDAETCNGTSKFVSPSTAPSTNKPTAGTVPLHANGHAKGVIKQECDVAGSADPNSINIGDGEEQLQHGDGQRQTDKPRLPQPKQQQQQSFQSGYPCQSGYGDIELSESDSEQSDSANPEEISISEPEEELYIPVPPSPTRAGQAMDTGPPATSILLAAVAAPAPVEASTTAPELANGDAPASRLSAAAPTHPSRAPVEIKIEPGLGAEGAAGVDQNQIEMDAMAFLAVNDDDSEDEQPQARPRRGQVNLHSCTLHCSRTCCMTC